MKTFILLILTTLTTAAQTIEVADGKELQKWIRCVEKSRLLIEGYSLRKNENKIHTRPRSYGTIATAELCHDSASLHYNLENG